MSRLLDALRMTETESLSEEIFKTAVEADMMRRRAGFGIDEWALLDDEERLIAIASGMQFERERAQMISVALCGGLGSSEPEKELTEEDKAIENMNLVALGTLEQIQDSVYDQRAAP